MDNQLNHCQICGGDQLIQRYPVTDTNESADGEWHIMQCKRCGTGVLSPFPSSEEISGFYRNVFYNEEGKRFRGWMEFARGKLAALRGKALNRLFPHKGRLLDFGSGAGHFAAAQADAGWEVYSVDPYSNASANRDCCQLLDDGFKLSFPDGYFDAVTLWYVIEHLRNPRSAVAELTRVLRPGGMLLLAQQDFASYQAEIFGANWLYLDPPRHIWQFTPASIEILATSCGLTPEKVSWASMEMGPFCILQSTLNVIVGNNNDLFRFLKNRRLPTKDEPNFGYRLIPTLTSLALLPILGPLSIVAYFMLLAIRSGDVFSVYCRKAR